MSFRSLLLVLACLQSFTMAQNENGPSDCCFSFLTQPIPVRVITDYEVTKLQCTKPGVIFTLLDGRHVCADPQDKWVKDHMNKLDQRLFNSLNKPEVVVGPDQCCTKFLTQPIPVRFITVCEETDPECTKLGVIFTLLDGRRVCADPQDMWVKHHMKTTDQRLFNSLNKPEAVDGPDQCCTKFLTQPITVRVITEYEVTDIRCAKPGVIFTLQNGHHVCADPQDKWVKNHMNRIEQHLFNSLINTEDSHGPDQCCFRFHTRPMPVRVITAYQVTDIRCTKPGVIFTLQNDRLLCANPKDKWVKNHMKRIDLINSLNNTEDGDEPSECCLRFRTRPIPVRVITDYEVTDPECLKPGVIFTLKDSRHVCADTGIKWVKNHMNRIDQRLFNSLNKPEDVVGPDQCCTKFLTQRIPVSIITAYKVTDPKCAKPGVIFTVKNGLRVCADPQDKWVKNNMYRIDRLLKI